MGSRRREVARRRYTELARAKQRHRDRHRIQGPELPSSSARTLDEAHRLIDAGDYDQAEWLLKQLDRQGPNSDVLEALVDLYQSSGDHDRCAEAAGRWLQLMPNVPEAQLVYAQESMMSGRATIARVNYQQFIERWPLNPHVPKAKTALEVLVPESEERIKNMGFPLENGLELALLHEESLAFLRLGKLAESAEKCLELLAKMPTFSAARNNLATTYFQQGKWEESIAVLRETLRLLPTNRFAEALLAKSLFLTGEQSEANQIGDCIVTDPPIGQDDLVMALEALACLGREEDILGVADAAPESSISESLNQAMRLHYKAFAKCRLGDVASARELWKKCLRTSKLYPPEARENLKDLDSKSGHAPWSESLRKWVPQPLLARLIRSEEGKKKVDLSDTGYIIGLVPVLLDRGDPAGREFALRLAKEEGSPRMLEAIKTFAFGSRGPDSMRLQALSYLRQVGAINAGPHRFYSGGQWRDQMLLTARINKEPKESSSSPEVLKLITRGIQAMGSDNYELAENLFQDAVHLEPDNPIAVYNLCTVWLRRNDDRDHERARKRLEQLHQDFPSYPFAAVGLAQFATMDGDFDKAVQLLAPIYRSEELHVLEATALLTAQTQLDLERGEIDAARHSLEALRVLTGDGDPNVGQLERRLDLASMFKRRR